MSDISVTEKVVRGRPACSSLNIRPVAIIPKKGDPVKAGIVIFLDKKYWISVSPEDAREIGQELIHAAEFTESIKRGDIPPETIYEYKGKSEIS